MSIDIYAGEHQSLDLIDVGAGCQWIEIPSEIGYSSSQTPEESKQQEAISSRAFLRTGRKYRAQIRVVSVDTRSRTFEIEIDTANQDKPVTLVE